MVSASALEKAERSSQTWEEGEIKAANCNLLESVATLKQGGVSSSIGEAGFPWWSSG